MYPYHLVQNGHDNFVQGCIKYYGSWHKTISAFGLNPTEGRDSKKRGWWTKQRIIYWIKYYESKGVQLSANYMRENHCALYGSAIHLFGSWAGAIMDSGFNYIDHLKVFSLKAWRKTLSQEQKDEIREDAKVNSKIGG